MTLTVATMVELSLRGLRAGSTSRTGGQRVLRMWQAPCGSQEASRPRGAFATAGTLVVGV